MAANGANNPDWSVRVLSKADATRRPAPASSAPKRESYDPADIAAPRKGGLTLGKAIQQARTALKVTTDSGDERSMTQTELDSEAGIARGTVQKYENGTAIYDATTVNKIARALDTTLPRPPKKAKSRD